MINNVETLAKVPSIVMHGPRWYVDLGTPKSAGTKLFAVSGSVVRPGVYEVPFGVPLRHLVYDLAGGLHPGRHRPGHLHRRHGRDVSDRRAFGHAADL